MSKKFTPSYVNNQKIKKSVEIRYNQDKNYLFYEFSDGFNFLNAEKPVVSDQIINNILNFSKAYRTFERSGESSEFIEMIIN
jgi:hypothetical protein